MSRLDFDSIYRYLSAHPYGVWRLSDTHIVRVTREDYSLVAEDGDVSDNPSYAQDIAAIEQIAANLGVHFWIRVETSPVSRLNFF